jgi:serine/threonine-protein kinase
MPRSLYCYDRPVVAHGEGIPFGKYRLLKRLARGGMAEVFLAAQSGPDGFRRRVAVKRILPHLADSQEFVGMFLDEARLAAALSHPNVVHVYDFGKVDDYYFITMEFVDGVDAGLIIKQSAHEPAPPELVARIVADAAAGLHHAHQLTDALGRPVGIVHRDISPQNLLISFDGVVKVVDFGIAKAAFHAERTRPGVVKGKFAYMSPEQVVGKSLDGRSDVFSLAVVAWEMLAGRYIVSRDNPAESMRLIRDGRLPAIESVRKDVPAPLARALGRALTKDFDDRPSAKELGLELEAYLKGASGIATSLAVAEWVRARFPREMTGPLPVLGGGTEASPGTVQATAGTAAATGLASASALAGGTPTSAEAPAARRAETAPPTDREAAPVTSAPSPPIASVAGTEMMPAARPRRRRGLAAAVGLAVGLVVVGVLWLAGAFSNGRARTPTVARAPAQVAPPTGPRVTPMAPVAPAADAAVMAVDPPVAPTTAELDIVTDPGGAHVALDGHALDTPTPAHIAELGEGEHTVQVTLTGYAPVSRRVTLAVGDRRTLEIALAPEPGTKPAAHPPSNAREERPRARPSTGLLTVRTIPYSDVYMNGRKLGTTPFADVELPAGTHTLVFKNPDKGVKKRTVVIRPGATTKLSFDL